jgi:hypothetical protein
LNFDWIVDWNLEEFKSRMRVVDAVIAGQG